MDPGKASVRVRAEREQPSSDRDETFGIRDARACKRVVTHVVERQPLTRPTALVRELGATSEVGLDYDDVAQEERGVDARAGDARVQIEQALGTRRPAVGCGLDELADGRVEIERQPLDALAQRVPGWKAVLARNDGLRVVQRESRAGEVVVARMLQRRQHAEAGQRGGISGARGAQQVFRLSLELIEVGRVGQGAGGRHTSSMLMAAVRKLASTETMCRRQ